MTTVEILESQVKKCTPNGILKYPGIDSCMTVTAIFDDGYKIGAHLVRSGGTPWKRTFHEWLGLAVLRLKKAKHGGLKKCVTAGVQACWVSGDEEEKNCMAGIWKAVNLCLIPEEDGKLENHPTAAGDITINADGRVTFTKAG